MADTIDRLQVELESNYKELLSGFEKTEKKINELEREFEQMEQTSNDLANEFNQTGGEMKDLEAKARELSSSFDTMADRANEAIKEIDTLNDKSIESKGSLDELNGVLGVFGVTVGMSAVIAAIESMGTFAIESADKFSEAMDTFALKAGLVEEEFREYADMIKEISGMTPYSTESIASVMADLESLNRGADASVIADLTAEWQAFMSMNPDASVEDFDRVFKKWGVSVEEQAGYLRAFNKIAQETHISMSALSSSLADGDRGYQMMGKNLIEAAAYLGEANYWGELDDAMSLPDTLEKIQAQKAEALGSDVAASAYVSDIWSKAVGIGDEGAIITYLKTVEGLGDNVARSIAASISSSVKDTESTVNTATKAMEASLVDLDNQIQTTEDKWSIIWNNMAIAMEPVGTQLTTMLDDLVNLSQMWNEGTEGKLGVIDSLLEGAYKNAMYSNPITLPGTLLGNEIGDELMRMLRDIRDKPTSPNINITQNITAPQPLNGAEIERAAIREAIHASKSLVNYY